MKIVCSGSRKLCACLCMASSGLFPLLATTCLKCSHDGFTKHVQQCCTCGVYVFDKRYIEKRKETKKEV